MLPLHPIVRLVIIRGMYNQLRQHVMVAMPQITIRPRRIMLPLASRPIVQVAIAKMLGLQRPGIMMRNTSRFTAENIVEGGLIATNATPQLAILVFSIA